MEYTTFTAQEFIDGKIIEMNDANKVYRAMAETIGADTEIADNLMGRGSENRALLRAIYQRLNEVIGEEE
jgi:NMD protein affecting ribosome stability and mRNA decay|tara:strand:+ start:244 stop:453 length:210 start_codon:yes stop_codon:yes gene_type:complete